MRWRRLALLFAVTGIGGCVVDLGTPTGPALRPLHLEVVQWDSLQTVVAGGDIVPPIIRVVNDKGVPQEGVRVGVAFIEQQPTDFLIRSNQTDSSGTWRILRWAPGVRVARHVLAVYIGEGTSGGAHLFTVNMRAAAPGFLFIRGDSVRLAVGETIDIPGLTGADDYGNHWDYPAELQFAVADSSIADVTADGRIRGVAEGRTTLIVTHGARRFTAWVVVGDPAALRLVPANLVDAHVTGMARDGHDQVYLVGEGTTSRLWRFDASLAVVDSAIVPGSDLRVAVPQNGQEAAIWSPTLRRLWVLSGDFASVSDSLTFTSELHDVQYSPDGKYLLLVSGSTLYRLDRITGDTALTSFASASAYALAVHDSLPRAYVSVGSRIFALDYVSGARLTDAPAPADVRDLSVDAQHNRLYATSINGPAVVAYDATTLARLGTSAERGFTRVAVGPGGSRIYVVGDDRVRVYDRSAILALESLILGRASQVIATSGAVLVLDGSGVLFRTAP